MFDKKAKDVTTPAAPGAAAAAPAKGDGFVPLELDMKGISWEERELIEGPVTDQDVFHSKKGDKRVLIVVVDGEPHRLIEQPGLSRLFDKVRVGDTIRVKRLGWRELPDGNEMRTFEASIKPGQGLTPAQEERAREQRDGRPSRRTER